MEKYALEIVDSKKIKGAKDNLAFLCSKKDGYTLVLFIDNTVMRSGMAMLFRNTLVFGSIFIVVIFLAAVFLAKKIVAPLEESYQKQRQFISDAGHELKTPVAVVSASTELLEREIGTNQWLSNIQYENQRMSVLIKQLLELARTENVKPQLEHLDFSRLVAGEMLPFESVAYERGLQLESDIAQNLYVEGNSSQLRQLVSILLDNAIEHSENRNVVRLTLHTEHNFASLFVINDGKEIPAEMQKQIFERFYRADKARSMDNGHFGLGLAIAKSIVVSHHGKINVSCYDGKVKFTVLLPLKK